MFNSRNIIPIILVIAAVASVVLVVWLFAKLAFSGDHRLIAIGAIFIIPMIPALVIYKVAPDSQVINAEGVLGSIKWNASGAFAGYIIVLGVMSSVPAITNILDTYAIVPTTTKESSTVGNDKNFKKIWSVQFDVEGVNEKNEQVELDINEYTGIKLRPQVHKVSSETIILQIPGDGIDDLPFVDIEASIKGSDPRKSGELGTTTLNIPALVEGEYEIDESRNKIIIKKPVKIRVISQPYAYPQE